MNILKLVDVYKAYDQHVAVNRVSFEIPSGSIFGLLGPNGAGKTSLIRIITTITQADSGNVYMNEERLNSRHPSQIGYMPEERGLYKKMKVGDHLMYLAQLKGLSRKKARQAIGSWFEKFDIQSWWPKKVEELSKGMQQKIQFISTVIHEPKLLILDEPFSGLDPINTNLIKDEIDALNKKGTSIIFSTHRMEQVEEVCEKIVLINQGKNVLEGGVAEIKNQFKKNLFEIRFRGTLPENIQEKAEIVKREEQSLTIKLDKAEDSKAFLQYLTQQDLYITAYNEVLPTINEIFIQQVAKDD